MNRMRLRGLNGMSSSVAVSIALAFVYASLKPVSAAGARSRVSGVGNDHDPVIDLDNFNYLEQDHHVPAYIWVIAGTITILTISVAFCTECCPGCIDVKKVKNLISMNSGRDDEERQKQAAGNGNTQQGRPRMLSISSDEFVVTFKN